MNRVHPGHTQIPNIQIQFEDVISKANNEQMEIHMKEALEQPLATVWRRPIGSCIKINFDA